MDDKKIAYMSMFASCWALLAGSLLIAAPVIWMKVKDTTDIEEDIKFSDEVLEDVAPTELLENRKQ
jgi:hypothetical protein